MRNGTPDDNAQRRTPRFKQSIRGSVYHQGMTYVCLVEDLNEHGLLLLSSAAIAVGEQIKVDLRLSEEMRLACMAEVCHTISDGFGVRIVEISERDSGVLSRLVEGHYASRFQDGR